MEKITSTSEKNINYPIFTLQASIDEKLFGSFKQNKDYVEILEHVSQQQGDEYIKCVDKNFLIENLHNFKKNDILGSPKKFNYEPYGDFSPTTLRYVKILDDLQKYFTLENSNIIEIGCGYGGQYVVMKQIYKPSKYTFVDLPTVLPLIKKYVESLNLDENTIYIDGKNTNSIYNDEYDLIISNYGISECNQETQNYYFEKILGKSKHGYITHNQFNGFPLDEFIKKLESYGKKVSILPESPLTSEKNVVLIW